MDIAECLLMTQADMDTRALNLFHCASLSGYELLLLALARQ